MKFSGNVIVKLFVLNTCSVSAGTQGSCEIQMQCFYSVSIDTLTNTKEIIIM